ncbi:PP2C family protein-serine/threonine phosphatase [Roseibium sediminicola]|uniref:Serine/threonine-protein phosphatase n=1 Tax=Roseibium sediminicola TaxID=2933272 RepID=A0ABT0GSY3_9HYPH|nr:serine/threonine-protein phosphatase [Roseibium sp. CAU 1639]
MDEAKIANLLQLLSQRIAMAALDNEEFSRASTYGSRILVISCADHMERAQAALLSGNRKKMQQVISDGLSCRLGKPDYPAPTDIKSDIAAILFEGETSQQLILSDFLHLARRVGAAQTLSPADRERFARLAFRELPVKFDAAARTFQANATQSLAWMEWFGLAAWVGMLALVGLVVVLVFSRLNTSMKARESEYDQSIARYHAQKQAMQEVNEQLFQSMYYARNIQKGILPDLSELRDTMADIALIWQPMQVVSGDYVWGCRKGNNSIFFIADCTGHGVPGALLTMVVASVFEKLLEDNSFKDPEYTLLTLDRTVRRRLGQDKPSDGFQDTASDDGFVAALAIYNHETRILRYAGAGIPLIVSNAEGFNKVAPDKAALGYRSLPGPSRIAVHALEVRPGDTFYLATDGITDHVGGHPKRTFGRKRLYEVLSRVGDEDLDSQLTHLQDRLTEFRGLEAVRDDYTILAFTPVAGEMLVRNAAE